MYNTILNEINNTSYSKINKMLRELEVISLARFIKTIFPSEERSIKELSSIICEEYNIKLD